MRDTRTCRCGRSVWRYAEKPIAVAFKSAGLSERLPQPEKTKRMMLQIRWDSGLDDRNGLRLIEDGS
jgi:hypothetical protein